jgi:hypothetical protein
VPDTIVIGGRPSDEPFAFEAYASIRSAQEHLGVRCVQVAELPYGYWWDLIRPTIELVSLAELGTSDRRLELGTIWLPGGGSVGVGEPGWTIALDRYRSDPDRVPALEDDERGRARALLAEVQRQLDAAEERRRDWPAPSPPVAHRRLCVAVPTFDDYTGVWATIGSIALHHPEVADRINFLILDNHPAGMVSPALKELDHKLEQLRYVPFDGYRSTAIRDLVFREADADIVLCLDSHVLLAPGALASLIDYFDAHPDSRDLLQGPLLSEQGDAIATHFDPEWGAGMYGRWGMDERGRNPNGTPFEIPMMGLGAFACRREAWIGINPRFRGFGGEEGYLHEKFRQAGGRVLCHPALRWQHRFERPKGIPYPNLFEDRVRNYLLGWREIGWDPEPIAAHFRELLGEGAAARVITQARRQLENPFDCFDAIVCLNLDREHDRWREMQARFEALDIGWRVERFPAIDVPANHHAGHVQSFRALIQQARLRGNRDVLLIEDDAVFLDQTLDVMRAATADLRARTWDLLFLGGHVWGEQFPFAPGSSALQVAGLVTSTHAVAVNHTAFNRLLDELPAFDDPAALETWLARDIATDQYLARAIDCGKLKALIVWPRVATQPTLRHGDDADGALGNRYTI